MQTHGKRDQICGYQRQGEGLGKLDEVGERYQFSVIRLISTGDVMYNIMTTVNTTSYLKVTKRVETISSHHRENFLKLWGDKILTELTAGVIFPVHVSQVTMCYTLNLHSVICQLYFYNTGRKKGILFRLWKTYPSLGNHVVFSFFILKSVCKRVWYAILIVIKA